MLYLPLEHASAVAAPKAPTVDLSPHAEEGTFEIARFLMKVTDCILDFFGQGGNETLFQWLYAVIVFAVAMVVGTLVQMLIVFVSRRISRHFSGSLYQYLLDRRFFIRTSRVIPAFLFLILIQFTLTYKVSLSTWLTRITWIYVVLILTWSVCTLVSMVWYRIDSRENKKKLPLKGLVQLVTVLIWCVAAIVVLAILFDKSPANLLAGLGAFAAVLMLVFKDSILGVVAGVQLSENDSLHVGDWIKVNGTDANGIVTEVTLTSVKVRNFDKTVTSLPPYNLVSGSFTNMRYMSESNTRRIMRSIMIDADSVVPVDDALLQKLAEAPLMKDWVTEKIRQRQEGKVANVNNPLKLVDGTIDTNLGVYRAYVKMYLDNHPRVVHNSQPGNIDFVFATVLPQTSTGIPLQFYCFTDTSVWTDYMAIQDEITEHLLSVLSLFNLYTFENPTGRDTLIDGYLSPGKNPDVLFGMPYPFFNNSGTPGDPASTSPQADTQSSPAKESR